MPSLMVYRATKVTVAIFAEIFTQSNNTGMYFFCNNCMNHQRKHYILYCLSRRPSHLYLVWMVNVDLCF